MDNVPRGHANYPICDNVMVLLTLLCLYQLTYNFKLVGFTPRSQNLRTQFRYNDVFRVKPITEFHKKISLISDIYKHFIHFP